MRKWRVRGGSNLYGVTHDLDMAKSGSEAKAERGALVENRN